LRAEPGGLSFQSNIEGYFSGFRPFEPVQASKQDDYQDKAQQQI
jgi:hypothetical protein